MRRIIPIAVSKATNAWVAGQPRWPSKPGYQATFQPQPVFVEDVAEIAINAAHKDENIIVDAAGPEIYTFDQLVRLIATKIHSQARIVHLEPGQAFFLSKLVGYMVRDVLLTRNELKGLMASLLLSGDPPTGKTRFSDWLEQNADTVGARYYPSRVKRDRV